MVDKITFFYAMEYINLFGNRILKVWITPNYIFAAKVKGLTSEITGYAFIDENFVVDPVFRENPKAYVNPKEENKYHSFFFDKLTPKQFMKLGVENFVLTKKSVSNISFTPKKKWGMGNYPHQGRIFIETSKEEFNKKKKREFIIIGNQDVERIMKALDGFII